MMWFGIVFVLFVIIYSALKERDKEAQGTLITIVVVVLVIFIVGLFINDNSTNDYKQNDYKCRKVGCNSKPIYEDWNRRYCSYHLKETHYCRYPGCMNEISNSNKSQYCRQHDD